MSLNFPPFDPHPLVRGGHLQTIVGAYLPWHKVEYRAVQVRVPLDDGDQLVLHDDVPADWQPGDRVAVLLHGLGGCYLSSYMQRCAAKLTARGCRVFRMDLRGSGAGFPLARLPVHAGRSEDARAALRFVSQRCPDSPVHVVGFSMGANIVLKMAGEYGLAAPPELASVMAVAPPIDLVECSNNMHRGTNRLYDHRFVRNLLAHVARRQRHVPDALTLPLKPRPRKLVEFDEQFTAPLSGFADVRDYYQRASSGPLLRHISVPTLILAAASDPIIPVAAYERASYSPTTQLLITPCGGHLGFLGKSGIDPDRRWLDWRVVDWIGDHSSTGQSPPQRRHQPALLKAS